MIRRIIALCLLPFAVMAATFNPIATAPVNIYGLPLLTKGALVVSDGTQNGESAVCANGEILKWDSNEPTGVKCSVGAHFVGRIEWLNKANCAPFLVGNTTWQTFPTDIDCGLPTNVVGSVSGVQDELAITINTPRTDGWYKVTFNLRFYTNDIGEQSVRLTDGTQFGGFGQRMFGNGSDNQQIHLLSYEFKFSDTANKTIRAQGITGGTGDAITMYATAPTTAPADDYKYAINVYFYPEFP